MKTRVLVAEDNKDMLELLSRQLDFLGYNVMAARNGLEAVALALSQHPDVIVMDLLMPKMDGLEAVSLIRDNPKTRGIPILAATAWVAPFFSRDKYLKSGFDGYIAKPFTLRDLQNAIGKLLRDSPERSVTGEQLVHSMDQSNSIAPAVSAKPIF
jgi:two-component system cell cycle response regulator DivK